MGDESTKTRTKFYVWRTNSTAGVTKNDYQECLRNFNGKPGGRCVKKFSSRIEADEEVKTILEEIRQESLKQACDGKETPNEEQETVPGHDDRYEEFINFKKEVTDFICKAEQQLSEILIENRELVVDIKDIECRMKNNFNELRMEIDRKITDIASDFESQLKAHRAELSRNNSKINKELRKLSETDKSLELSIQSSKLASVDNETKSPDRRNSPDHTLLSDPSTAGDAQHEIERSALPLNRSTPREAFDRQEPLDPNSDPNRDDDQPILILTDSMLRVIIQNKFAPNRYTN